MIRTDLELLSPAGSFEGFLAAMNAGADAVYAGGLKFGARAYAQNFTEDEFLKAIDIAHLNHRKLYMTVNTLCKEREREDLIQYLRPYYEQGLDGVIVQDIGVISMLRDIYPDLPVHGSTQMSVSNSYGAKLLQSLGVSRVVPARELSLDEIRSIHEKTGIEIEAFVHGAMCYSYSGQCLFSSMLGGRSGNRGRCAQPCRLPYSFEIDGKLSKKDSYVLSMKDLCTVTILPDMIANHITSFKIEGRMKQPEYTAAVTSVYRKYIDRFLEYGAKSYSVEKHDLDILTHSFSRIDPQTGYYFLHNGRSLITLTKPGYEQGEDSAIYSVKTSGDLKIPLTAYCSMSLNGPASLTLVGEDYSVTVYGDVCQQAVKMALDEETVRKQLSKFGDSDFVLSDLHIEMEDGLFLPVKSLNSLRRDAISEMTQAIIEPYRRNSGIISDSVKDISVDAAEFDNKKNYSILCENMDQLLAVIHHITDKNTDCVKRIYIESSILYSVSRDQKYLLQKFAKECASKRSIEIILALPYVFRKKDHDQLSDMISEYESLFDGFLIRTFDEIRFIDEITGNDWILIADHNLYSFNQASVEYFIREGFDYLTYPLELNYHEMKERGFASKSELLIYGHIPMMISSGCVRKTNNQCHLKDNKKTDNQFSKTLQGADHLIDRYDKKFPMISDCCYCYNRILNTVPISLHTESDTIQKLNPSMKRIQFSVEDKELVEKILDLLDRDQFSQMGSVITEFTKGHFKKSVE